MTEKLLPCPFCGDHVSGFDYDMTVTCYGCYARADTPEQWNTRVAQPAASAEPAELGPIRVGNLPTMNQDEYPGLGDWWVQLRIGSDGDEVLARVYGDTPEQARSRAVALAAPVAAQDQPSGNAGELDYRVTAASGQALTDQDGAARVDAVYAALTDRAKRFVSKESVQEVLAAIEAQPHLYDGDTLTAAYMAGQDSARVPDGWKLVPVEPTDEMSGAGWDHIDVTVGQCQDGPKDVYRAMLEAAPAPPADEHRVNPTVEPDLDTLPATPEEEEEWQRMEGRS